MELVIDRRFDPERTPGSTYTFPYRATLTLKLTEEEHQLVRDYQLGDHILTQSRFSITKVSDALHGATERVGSLDTLIGNEKAMKEACESLLAMLEYCRTFGSQVSIPIS